MTLPLILTAGEALIDWVSRERGADLAAATVFTRAPGGAPLNVAVGLARLGVSVGFAGCLAEDPFGDQLAQLLRTEGIDAARVRRVGATHTRMAYVVTLADGERELASFSRTACADLELTESDLPESLLRGLEGFYFGSLPLSASPARAVLLEAAAKVKSSGGLVVFDPNVRMVLWSDAAKLSKVLRAALEVSHVVKLGHEELMALTGTDDLSPGADRLLAVHSPLAAVVVTYGARGAGVRVRGGVTLHVPAPTVPVTETTGAGDGFVAGFLAALLDERRTGERLAETLMRLDEIAWERTLERANAVGALVTTRAGAVAALPRRAELEAFLASKT